MTSKTLPHGSPGEYTTYSLREVSSMTRIPLRTLYDMVHDGTLATVCKSGAKRGWRVTDAELRRYLGLEGDGSDEQRAR